MVDRKGSKHLPFAFSESLFCFSPDLFFLQCTARDSSENAGVGPQIGNCCTFCWCIFFFLTNSAMWTLALTSMPMAQCAATDG